jgi:hypothetical protein
MRKTSIVRLCHPSGVVIGAYPDINRPRPGEIAHVEVDGIGAVVVCIKSAEKRTFSGLVLSPAEMRFQDVRFIDGNSNLFQVSGLLSHAGT